MSWRACKWLGVGVVFVLVVSVVGCGSTTGESTATITGRVTGVEGSPENVTVSVQGTSLATTVDADGYFTLRGVPSGRQTVSLVDEQAGTAAHLVLDVVPGQPMEIPPVLLRPAGQIAGIVSETGENGLLTPIPGAQVVATPSVLVDTLATPPDETDVPPPPPFPPIRLVAYTDSQGTYSLRGVPPGTYLVTAGKLGYREATQALDVSAGRTTPGDFVLERVDLPQRGSVVGKVAEADPAGVPGQPIEGALVAALPPESVVNSFGDLPPIFEGVQVDDRQQIRPIRYTALTDENGEYSLRPPAGEYLLVAAKWGYVPQGQKVTVVAGEQLTVDFALQKESRPLLQVQAATDQPSYPEGQTVGMTVSVSNVSDSPVTLTFGGQEFDFAVFKDRTLVWRWSQGMAFPAVMTTVTLQPGESKTYAATWDQKGLLGQPVAPGEYALVGAIMAVPAPGQPDLRPLTSRPYPFTITPAPTPLG